MKKILYLLTHTQYGGSQKYVRDMALNLSPADFEVALAIGQPHNAAWLAELERAGLRIIKLKHMRRQLSPWRDLMSIFELRQLYKKNQPDVLHLNNSKMGALGALAATHLPIKVVYTVHGFVLNEPLSPWRWIYYWLAEKISSYFKDEIICVSEYDKQSLLKYKITSEKKINVIYNGIDVEQLIFLTKDDARKKISQMLNVKCQMSDVVIGSIAGLYKTKGLEHLISSATLLPLYKGEPEGVLSSLRTKEGPGEVPKDLKFIIIGSGPEEERLRTLIKHYNLEDKFFIVKYEQNAAELLKAFDIFVLPSVKEGLPYTLLEAQAAGLPIIATRVGGIPEIIEHQKTGLLVKPANVKILASSIQELINSQELRHVLPNNRTEQPSFTLKEMVNQTRMNY